MTHLIFLYFQKYKKLSGEGGEDVSFDESMLLNLSRIQK